VATLTAEINPFGMQMLSAKHQGIVLCKIIKSDSDSQQIWDKHFSAVMGNVPHQEYNM
jgi:hypothetical protein